MRNYTSILTSKPVDTCVRVDPFRCMFCVTLRTEIVLSCHSFSIALPDWMFGVACTDLELRLSIFFYATAVPVLCSLDTP